MCNRVLLCNFNKDVDQYFSLFENKSYVRFVPLEMFRCGRASRVWRSRLATEALRQLQTLTLDLRSNSIKDAGCKALAEKLGGLQQLQTLTLDLSFNSIEDAGFQALENLKAAREGRGEDSNLLPLSDSESE